MKTLLDMPVTPQLINVLKQYGHEGVHAHQIGKDRAPDIELLNLARHENRVIITADLDFPTTFSSKFSLWAGDYFISRR